MPIEGLELENRTCDCGCGGKWRAMKGSPNRFSSVTHSPGHEPTDVFRPKKAGRPRRKKSDYTAETDELPPEPEEFEPVSRYVDLPTDTSVDV